MCHLRAEVRVEAASFQNPSLRQTNITEVRSGHGANRTCLRVKQANLLTRFLLKDEGPLKTNLLQ